MLGSALSAASTGPIAELKEAKVASFEAAGGVTDGVAGATMAGDVIPLNM